MGTYIADAAELRLAIPGLSVTDPVLEDVIDAIETEIDARFGALTATLVRLYPAPGSRILVLPRKASSISSVVERTSSVVYGDESTTLDPTDYRLAGARRLERLAVGPNPSSWWSAYGIDVTMVPVDDSTVRKRVVVDVAKIDLAQSGYVSRRIGEYAETTASGQGASVDEQREAIFRRIRRGRLVFS